MKKHKTLNLTDDRYFIQTGEVEGKELATTEGCVNEAIQGIEEYINKIE